MSDITKISILENGDQTTVDTTVSNVVTDTVTVGGVGGTVLSKTVLDSLIASSGNPQVVDKFTLSGTDITNKFVTLSQTPLAAGDTILVIGDAGGIFYGVDFTVSSNQLGWSGLGLDGILSSGDNLTVTYKA